MICLVAEFCVKILINKIISNYKGRSVNPIKVADYFKCLLTKYYFILKD